MKTILKGKGFLLRPIRMSDAQKYFESETDPVSKKGFMSTPKSVKEVENSIKEKIAERKKKKPSRETFAIDIGGEFVGYVGLHDMNEKFNEHRAIISYCLHPKFRGKGIMTKAVRLATRYAFEKYSLRRIAGRCRTFNKASARVLEKAGYKLEGIHRKELFKDGRYLDNMYWAVVK